jgi:hypothetical protein
MIGLEYGREPVRSSNSLIFSLDGLSMFATGVKKAQTQTMDHEAAGAMVPMGLCQGRSRRGESKSEYGIIPT